MLGPCLVLARINDLPDRVSSPSRLFADDTISYRYTSCTQDSVALQKDLRKLEQWETRKNGRCPFTWTIAIDYQSPGARRPARNKSTTPSMVRSWRQSPQPSTWAWRCSATSDGELASTTSVPRRTGCSASWEETRKSAQSRSRSVSTRHWPDPSLSTRHVQCGTPTTTSTSPTLRRFREGQHALCWTDTGTPQVLETCSINWNGQPYSTDAGPYASPCCTRSPLVKRVWGALTSNSSLQVEEEATTASSTNASAAAQTTEATPSSPAQSGTGTNSPQIQFCPPPLAPSSRRCHPPPSKSKNFSFSLVSSSFCLYHY